MNKKQLQKIEYERQCHIRRKHIPIILEKNFNSLRLVEILKRNERTVKWCKYPELEVPKKYTNKWEGIAESCLMERLGLELIAGMNEKDLEKFYVNIFVNGPAIVVHIHSLTEVKTTFGTGVYLKKNPIFINGKQLLISTHALERITERAFFNLPQRNKFIDHIVKFRAVELMIVGDVYGNIIEVYIPYRNQEGPKQKFWKVGYFVIAEMENFYYAKTFELPGYCGTPEEFLIDKPWKDMTFDEVLKVHEKSKQAVEAEMPVRDEIKLSDFTCITTAWKREFLNG